MQIDYPEEANRLTTFFRPILIIPVAIILMLISGASFSYYDSSGDMTTTYASAQTAGGILIFPVVLMILFRKKYPRWWFDWNLGLTRFSLRVISYMIFLQQVYPSTDEDQVVHVKLIYPDADKLGRGMPLVKWFLAIPHYLVLFFLLIAVFFVTIFAWFAILFTGKYPRSLFDFVVGVMRWGLRVEAYAMLLTTDKYPPFSLQP